MSSQQVYSPLRRRYASKSAKRSQSLERLSRMVLNEWLSTKEQVFAWICLRKKLKKKYKRYFSKALRHKKSPEVRKTRFVVPFPCWRPKVEGPSLRAHVLGLLENKVISELRLQSGESPYAFFLREKSQKKWSTLPLLKAKPLIITLLKSSCVTQCSCRRLFQSALIQQDT